ncbi:MAG: hypothetical protein ACLQIB_20815 [Isosphaeraceae bacterium]
MYKKDCQVFDNELKYFLQWMGQEPYLRSLLVEIESEEITLEAWEPGNFDHQHLALPESEIQTAKICLQICRRGQSLQDARKISESAHFNDALRDFVEMFVDPLVTYMEDRIEEGSSVLSILERYKRRTEWFHRERLFGLYADDTTRGESRLDGDLREYLVDHGVSYPFSQPTSPSGEADIVACLDSADPMTIEVKVFGGPNQYDDAYLRKGFSQAYRYAADYHVPAGYLVVFNLSEKLLLFETQARRQWPAAVHLADKTIYLVAIDINPSVPSASKDRTLARHVVTERYLVEGLK